MVRSLVLDERSGWVLEQHLYNEGGGRIASAVNSKHQLDPIVGATLPRQTDIEWPAQGMKLSLELREVELNTLQLSPELWSKPEYAGYSNIDVTQPLWPTANQMPAAYGSPPGSPMQGYYPPAPQR